jgi:hypothetical protein
MAGFVKFLENHTLLCGGLVGGLGALLHIGHPFLLFGLLGGSGILLMALLKY